MELRRGLLLLAFALFAKFTMAQVFQSTFTTTIISGAKYSPYHVLAVWVEDSNGKYVRTLLLNAKTRKSYLYKWNGNSGGDVTDAVTGATISAHKEHTVTWDLKDYAKNVVPAGTYKLCLEMTSENKQGPFSQIDFTVGGAAYTSNPANQSNFSNISLAYNPGTTTSNMVDYETNVVKLYPNPSKGNLNAEIYLVEGSKTKIDIFDMKNNLQSSKSVYLSEGSNQVSLNSEIAPLPKGIYLLLVTTNHYKVGQKLVVE